MNVQPKTVNQHTICTMDRLQSALPFLEAIETLKGLKRTGWCRRGVPDPESVSDHMYRMTFVCLAHPEVCINAIQRLRLAHVL